MSRRRRPPALPNSPASSQPNSIPPAPSSPTTTDHSSENDPLRSSWVDVSVSTDTGSISDMEEYMSDVDSSLLDYMSDRDSDARSVAATDSEVDRSLTPVEYGGNLADGSYVDAETTESMFSSQTTNVQLIYPTPEASFVASGTVTPGALVNEDYPHDDKWEFGPVEDIYLRGLAENMNESKVQTMKDVLEVRRIEEKKGEVIITGSAKERRSKFRLLLLRGANKRWISVMAFAAASLALLRSFGPGLPSLFSEQIWNSLSSSTFPQSSHVWEHLHTSPPPTTTSSITSLDPTAKPAPPAQYFPDMRPLRYALSTFSYQPAQAHPGTVSLTSSDQMPKHRAQSQSQGSTSSCCSMAVAVRDSEVALTTTNEQPISRPRRHKKATYVNAHDQDVINSTSSMECHCPPAVWEDFFSNILNAAGLQHALSSFLTNDAVHWIYASALTAIRSDLENIQHIAEYLRDRVNTITSVAYTITQAGVERLHPHVMASWKYLRNEERLALSKAQQVRSSLSPYISDWFATFTSPSPPAEVVHNAKQGLESVRTVIDEKASVLQTSSTETLHKARRGLDVLLGKRWRRGTTQLFENGDHVKKVEGEREKRSEQCFKKNEGNGKKSVGYAEKKEVTKEKKEQEPRWYVQIPRDRPLPYQMRDRWREVTEMERVGKAEGHPVNGQKVSMARKALDMAYHVSR
ncbi:hypothetical protein TREMEDRAFT_58800 [Tremella mesenterica DSM 1558]|uniref:uncharacterized protein n=1 Tax=Tremella mesenterica (strain ATCC 24925 / CBS 8224 / DSM 1558 / NBRC 9311 / NRRL Y-6157 / RJB 2259-6 / UBC 559-6) TaxID=578456 RepID=UPI0003F4992C|nr:uncharacterized protein TREMEDRAFT_58800 [Tremella mesenterica DSM 1558]EIW72630.1 hypothetical protein TREMEDRAFT_58800 [Tremella mesenterica DSM 1558]